VFRPKFVFYRKPKSKDVQYTSELLTLSNYNSYDFGYPRMNNAGRNMLP